MNETIESDYGCKYCILHNVSIFRLSMISRRVQIHNLLNGIGALNRQVVSIY